MCGAVRRVGPGGRARRAGHWGKSGLGKTVFSEQEGEEDERGPRKAGTRKRNRVPEWGHWATGVGVGGLTVWLDTSTPAGVRPGGHRPGVCVTHVGVAHTEGKGHLEDLQVSR